MEISLSKLGKDLHATQRIISDHEQPSVAVNPTQVPGKSVFFGLLGS